MSVIFILRALSDEDEEFYREYEAQCGSTLAELHEFLCGDLRLDRTVMTSFFTADKYWNRLQEFTLLDMGMEAGYDGTPAVMEKVRLEQVVRNVRDRLVYQFDMIADRAVYMEMTGVFEEREGVRYPRAVLSKSVLPSLPGTGEPDGGISAFEKALANFGDFEGDDSYDDEQ